MSDLDKLINEIYLEFKTKVGPEKARKFIALVIDQAITECHDDDIAKAIRDAIEHDHTTFVKNKKAA